MTFQKPRVVCCHATTDDSHIHRPETRAALETLWPDRHELVNVTGTTTRYHETLERYWSSQAPFIVIEQDVVPTEHVRDAFDSCAEPWCVFVGELSVGYTPGWLGCARFSGDLLRAEPDAMTEAGRADTSGPPARVWWRIDVRLDRILRDRGYRPHVHGRVQHLNTVSTLADPEGAYLEFLERHALPFHH